jgi:hypothetical protein
VRCVTRRKAHARNHTRLSALNGSAPWPHPPKPLTLRTGATGATKFGIDYEDRAVCGSPRSEGSPSAFHRGRDRNHVNRMF